MHACFTEVRREQVSREHKRVEGVSPGHAGFPGTCARGRCQTAWGRTRSGQTPTAQKTITKGVGGAADMSVSTRGRCKQSTTKREAARPSSMQRSYWASVWAIASVSSYRQQLLLGRVHRVHLAADDHGEAGEGPLQAHGGSSARTQETRGRGVKGGHGIARTHGSIGVNKARSSGNRGGTPPPPPTRPRLHAHKRSSSGPQRVRVCVVHMGTLR